MSKNDQIHAQRIRDRAFADGRSASDPNWPNNPDDCAAYDEGYRGGWRDRSAQLGPVWRDARDCLHAEGLHRGWVVVTYDLSGPLHLHAASMPEGAREWVEIHNMGPMRTGGGRAASYCFAEDKPDYQLDFEASIQAESERLYASSYGLGL